MQYFIKNYVISYVPGKYSKKVGTVMKIKTAIKNSGFLKKNYKKYIIKHDVISYVSTLKK